MGNASNFFLDQPDNGYQYAFMLGVLVAPLSRGNVTLRSAQKSDLLIINPNWLASKTDQEMAIAIFRQIRQAFQSYAMAPVVIGKEYNLRKQVQSDQDILDYIKNNIMTIWHAACTCKMGIPNHPMAVVDNEGKVFGVNGLRVVDASVFPFLPPGHPQSTVCKCT